MYCSSITENPTDLRPKSIMGGQLNESIFLLRYVKHSRTISQSEDNNIHVLRFLARKETLIHASTTSLGKSAIHPQAGLNTEREAAGKKEMSQWEGDRGMNACAGAENIAIKAIVKYMLHRC